MSLLLPEFIKIVNKVIPPTFKAKFTAL